MAAHVGPHVDAGVHGGHHGAPPRPVRLPVRVLRVVQRGEPTGGLARADGRKHGAVATRCTHAFCPWSVLPSLTIPLLFVVLFVVVRRRKRRGRGRRAAGKSNAEWRHRDAPGGGDRRRAEAVEGVTHATKLRCHIDFILFVLHLHFHTYQNFVFFLPF